MKHAGTRKSRVFRFEDLRQDNEFVKDCGLGDQAAWEALVRRHRGRVYGMCHRFTRSRSEAQDMTQEVFLRVFCSLSSFRSTEVSFVAWLNLLTRNLLIDNYRRRRKDRATTSLDGFGPHAQRLFSIEHHGPAYERTERARLLRAALDRLPPDLRQTVALYGVRGFQYEEIAGHLGVPVGTVKSRLSRGRTALQRHLAPFRMAA
jgi:RNA polymerase sigma-70 factor (ECF subfamily)